MIEHWHGTSFDWQHWSGGGLTNLGIQHNHFHVWAMRHVIRKYAIAWCEGPELLCRSKPFTVGIMFLQGEFQWWTHLWEIEAIRCFPEVNA